MADYQLLERVSQQQLGSCVERLAERINNDYKGKNLVLIGILNGAFIFMADLARRLDLPIKMDFVRLASYGDKMETCGNVRITKDVEIPLHGCHVITKLEFYFYVFPIYPDLVCFRRLAGRTGKHSAAGHIELRPMGRAQDNVA